MKLTIPTEPCLCENPEPCFLAPLGTARIYFTQGGALPELSYDGEPTIDCYCMICGCDIEVTGKDAERMRNLMRSTPLTLGAVYQS